MDKIPENKSSLTNIIIIDNYLYNLNLFKAGISQNNYAVLCTDNTPQAINILTSLNKIALIILDFNLYNTNIFSFINFIRCNDSTKETPIILLHDNELTEEDFEKIHLLEYIDILLKPFSLDALKLKVSFLSDLYNRYKKLEDTLNNISNNINEHVI